MPLRERSLPSVRLPVERLTGRQGRGRGARGYGASAAGEKREATHCVTCNVDSIQCVQCVKCVQCVRCAASPIGSKRSCTTTLCLSPSVSHPSPPYRVVALRAHADESAVVLRPGDLRRCSQVRTTSVGWREDSRLKPFIAVARPKREKRAEGD